MATFNGLPVYKIKVNTSLESNEGIDFISLVSQPAIETNWIAMATNLVKVAFDKPKQLLYGPILIPDQYIFRSDAKMGDYYVVFTAPEIEAIVRKFQSQQKTLNINYQHQDNSQVKESVVQEIWLTGDKDKSQDLGFNLPKGSAFAVTHIGNSEFWAKEVESGNVRGYSIEGWLDMELNKQTKYKFMEAKTKDGLTIKTSAESFTVGSDVVIVATDATETPAEGEYELENGTVIKCTAGKVTEIMAVEESLSEAEVVAMTKMFSAIIKPLQDKIAELEVKLSSIPAAPSKTEKTDEPEPKPTALQSAVIKLNKIKELTKK